jgi:adenylyltransferase/sulfurtransferase
MPVIPNVTACLRCVYPEQPTGVQPTCETAGVLNAIVSLVASLQVADALKILSGHANLVRPRITTADVWDGGIRQIAAPERDSECPTCGRREFSYLERTVVPPVSLCGRNAVQVRDRERPIDLLELAERLKPLGAIRANEYALRFFIPPYELTIFPDGRAIVKGTADPGVARSLYARYVG